MIQDKNANVVWKWEQAEPSGASVPNADPDGDGVAFDFPLRFPGQYFDRENNLSYNDFRDCYDPTLGRYCQSDPIGLEGSLNTYQYAGGDPVDLSDPSGLLLTSLHMLSTDPTVAQNATLVSSTGTGPAMVAVGTIGPAAVAPYIPGAVVGTGLGIQAAGSAIVTAATQPAWYAIWLRIISLLKPLPPNSALPPPPTPVPPAIIRQVPQVRQPGPPGGLRLPAVGGAAIGKNSCP